ncbi:MAG: hypothetical protein Q7S58_13365 [Candidatus Binatus sp.]|uniref:hypothetical protein n=1 Tax=Candidatus Binatus sp. TaxID=2811406 RepID=UPI002723CEC6|nr:hypothetical protein [Candidatus Binatus sp.]MDO8433387.1 hypothetical protein [Candidatus Binatus sp.]
MNEYPWYEEVSVTAPLTQGDIIESCPVLVFDTISNLAEIQNDDEYAERLKESIAVETDRVIVMTQACDLEQNKVRNVILCPAYIEATYHSQWKEVQDRNGQKSNSETWRRFLNDVKNGHKWNLALIQSRFEGNVQTPLQIVDFHEVLSLPRDFLEAWIRKSGNERLRVLPPYREHLSQAFARFFMRVGLPQDVQISNLS